MVSPVGECPVGGTCAHKCPPAECYRENVERMRPRMVWSRRLDRYVRSFMTDSEWIAYNRKGSID